MDADKFARSEFEQLRWPTGQTSRMKFVIEPTWMYLRRVGVGKPVRAKHSSQMHFFKPSLPPLDKVQEG
jgi:hypothetical protein